MDTRNAPYIASVPSDQPNRGGSDVRNSLTVGASIAAWSIGAFAFYLIAGRALGPDAYGLVAALQSLVVIVALPIVALQWSTARIAAAATDNTQADGQAAYRRGLVLSTGVAVVLAGIATIVTALLWTTNGDIPFWPDHHLLHDRADGAPAHRLR